MLLFNRLNVQHRCNSAAVQKHTHEEEKKPKEQEVLSMQCIARGPSDSLHCCNQVFANRTCACLLLVYNLKTEENDKKNPFTRSHLDGRM